MTTKLLWFVLAGFLLGFTTSTLWEWFHFRRRRLQLTDARIRELEDQLRETEPPPEAPDEDEGAEPEWAQRGYRSPGVFLESEDLRAEDGEAVGEGREAPRAAASSSGLHAPASQPSTPQSSTPEPDPSLSQDTGAPQPGRRRDDTAPASDETAASRDAARRRQEMLARLRRESEAATRQGESRAGQAPAGRAPQASTSPHTQPAPAPTTAAPSTASPRSWTANSALTRPSPDHPDDLSKIKGIGDVYRYRLYRAGIYTWHQVATSDEETLRSATNAYPSSNVDEWLPQAQALAEKFGRTNAVYSGPPPDDLTKILGIGPVGAESLYKAGICTYEQLASVSREELAELFPIAVAGDQPDFDHWIQQATELADEKHQDG